MKVLIFGKDTCKVCHKLHHKFEFYLERWNMLKTAQLIFHNMNELNGLTEGAYYEIPDIPTVVIENNSGDEIIRWVKTPPPSKEFKPIFEEILAGEN